MTGKTFINSVANGKEDVIAVLLKLLNDTGADYCVIGGLAVNAYVEPVVSLDLDIVVVLSDVELLYAVALAKGLKVERYPYSVNMTMAGSDLRIQVQLDERYQGFIQRASVRSVLGYEMKVAAMEDVLQGKLWAYQDVTRRRSKRQKDLADIMRLVESYAFLQSLLPAAIQKEVEQV